MTMQAWSPDPGGTNYRSRRHSCVYFGNAGKEKACRLQENTEVAVILAPTSVKSEKKLPAVSKRIPKQASFLLPLR